VLQAKSTFEFSGPFSLKLLSGSCAATTGHWGAIGWLICFSLTWPCSLGHGLGSHLGAWSTSGLVLGLAAAAKCGQPSHQT